MLGYKQKLLDIPQKAAPEVPDGGKKAAKPARPEPPISHAGLTDENLSALRESLRKELEKDLEELRSRPGGPESKDRYRGSVFGIWILGALLILLGVSAGAGFWWTHYRRVPELLAEIHSIQNQLPLQLKEFFERPGFQAHLEERAGEYTAQNLQAFWTAKVDETLLPYVKEVQSLTSRVRYESETSIKNLNSVSAFMLLESRAQNDDRVAFEELLKISRDRNDPFRDLAKQASIRIFTELSSAETGKMMPDYPLKDKLKGLTLHEFKKVYRESIPLYRAFILEDFWANALYTKPEKLGFLAEVIGRDTSLRALQKACQLMDREAMLYKPFTAYEVYLNWWVANQKKYQEQAKNV